MCECVCVCEGVCGHVSVHNHKSFGRGRVHSRLLSGSLPEYIIHVLAFFSSFFFSPRTVCFSLFYVFLKHCFLMLLTQTHTHTHTHKHIQTHQNIHTHTENTHQNTNMHTQTNTRKQTYSDYVLLWFGSQQGPCHHSVFPCVLCKQQSGMLLLMWECVSTSECWYRYQVPL